MRTHPPSPRRGFLGEHAIGLSQDSEKKLDYKKGPRKTEKDVQDVFDDCGGDFDSIEILENETYYHH